MKRFYLLLVVALLLFSSCDWRRDPQIVGYTPIELNEKNEFVCFIEDVAIPVDSILLANETEKIYDRPYIGQYVTCFTIGNHTGFYEGIANADEIKKVYFIGDTVSSSINFFIVFMVVILLYGYATTCKEKDEDIEEAQKVKQSN